MSRVARLTDCYFCGPRTKHFRFQVEGPERFQFQPGQHISVLHDVNGREEARPYSIASPPRGDNSLELCLNRVDEGAFSNYLFDLPRGARVRFEGPEGGFVLCPRGRDALFTATGTGIAPIRSMLHHLLATGTSRDMALLFGVRYENSILYRDEFERLAREHPTFRFIPTLSRPGEHWTGETGYVQEHVLRLLAGRSDVDVYLCGLKAMVDEVRGLLAASGFDLRSVFYEKYD